MGEPVNPATVAVAVCVSAVLPRTRVAEAMPLALVFEEGVIDPPPPAAQVTAKLLIGLLPRSVTNTVYAVASVVPIVSVCELPPFSAIVLGLPGFAVEVKVTGDPVSPLT